MPITAAVNIYTDTFENGSWNSLILGENERLLMVSGLTILYDDYWRDFWNHIRSCEALANENEDTILILFDNPFNGYTYGPELDYHGNFLQLRQHRGDWPDDTMWPTVLVDDIPSAFPGIHGVGSMLLIGGSRQNNWEFGFSVRDALESRWNQELDNVLQDLNSGGISIFPLTDPTFTWEMAPVNIQGLNVSLRYIALHQRLHLDIATGTDLLQISNSIWLSIYIHLWIDNGEIRGEFTELDVDIGGSFHESFEVIIQELFNCRIPQLEGLLNQQLDLVNDSLANAGLTIKDMYFLPGNQIDYGQLQVGDTDVWLDNHPKLSGNTRDDVTIVLELPV